MAEYRFPTVVTPEIPSADMTPLEALILSTAFDETPVAAGSYFHARFGPSDILTIDAPTVRRALEASAGIESPVLEHVTSLIEELDAQGEDVPDDLDIDVSDGGHGWAEILEAVVDRSETIDEIVVTAAFTCSKMRPDGFGGSVMRISKEGTQYASTHNMLHTMREDATMPTDGGHETRGRLEAIASAAGWDSFTLLLLIARWLESSGSGEGLIRHLDEIATAEDAPE